MALEGSIEDFGLTEIFQLILLQKKEGVLTLTQGKKVVLVEFSEGQIIRALEGNEDEIFGNMLIQSGKITIDQLKIGLREQKNKKQPLRKTLAELGYITSAEIRKMNRLLTEETIFQLFDWKKGDYQFKQNEIAYDPEFIEPLSTEFTLMEGMRRIDEWPFLLQKIPSRQMVLEIVGIQPSESVQVKLPDKEDSFQSPEDLSGQDQKEEDGSWILQWIDGERSVQEIVDHAGRGAFPVYKAISDLLSHGKVRAKGEKGDVKSKHLSFGELTRSQSILKALIGSTIIVASVMVFILSTDSIRATFMTAGLSIQEIKKLHIWNEKDLLRFALDLYYLRYHHYPDSLTQLVEEGLLRTERERAIDLTKWIYSAGEQRYDLKP